LYLIAGSASAIARNTAGSASETVVLYIAKI